jgi:nucleoside 2-deoxyribosyltransferase
MFDGPASAYYYRVQPIGSGAQGVLNNEGITELRERLTMIHNAASSFFDKAQKCQDEAVEYGDIWDDILPPEPRQEGESLRSTIKHLSVDIAGAARGSPLIAEADLQDLRHNTRRMLASIHFRKYRHWGVYVHHDEGTVLGVDPPSQEEEPVSAVADARPLFNNAAASIGELIDLLSPAGTIQASPAGTASYRPNTAFIMMAMDKNQPELEDVKNSIKDVCKEFGIAAITADDIEHESAVTDRVLEEIETNEFLIADLTGERPNVYYEIGHAHAHNKRVHLFRKTGTKLHFDVAHRNCPEYANITDLKEQLRKRMVSLTNKPQKT